MTKDEALKMARTALGVQLDALLGKAGHLRNDDRRRYAENGIKAIDEALAQPEQEPVAWRIRCTDPMRDWVLMYRHPKTEEQFSNMEIQPLYTTPPQRKPLTDEEIGAILEDVNAYGTRLYTFARAIEAAHGIKGEA